MAHDDHGSHHVNYLAVFLALCVFTGLSCVFDILPIENHAVTIVLVMAVAVAKALCVMMFFMHLKFERNWKYILLTPTTILAIGLPLALMPDIGVAYYISTAPQDHEWGEQMEEYRATHGGHGEDSQNTENAHHADRRRPEHEVESTGHHSPELDE